MKTTIKVLVVFLMLFMGATVVEAQSSKKNYKLVMVLANGKTISSSFSQKPVMTFSGESMVLKSTKGELGTWKFSEVKSWKFEENIVNVGDANEDGLVSVADLSLMASSILGVAYGMNEANADMNGDGVISVADLSALASIILAQ